MYVCYIYSYGSYVLSFLCFFSYYFMQILYQTDVYHKAKYERMINCYHFVHDFGWLCKLITYIPMLITIQLVTIKTTPIYAMGYKN